LNGVGFENADACPDDGDQGGHWRQKIREWVGDQSGADSRAYGGPADADREPLRLVSETLQDVEPEQDPDPSDLTRREAYIARKLQRGSTLDALADDLGERTSIVQQYLKDLRRQGWRVYVDEESEHIGLRDGHELRSSEHIGQRTRKANRWWQKRHNELVREFRSLETPACDLLRTDGREDWVLHMTDLHAGDRVRTDSGEVVYSTAEIPDIVEYTTQQSIGLAEHHNAEYDAAHILWGGDFVTNEGIYEGQFENLDAWLDEQHDVLVGPLVEQLKAFSRRFPVVQVVCQVGNHGQHRASGTSRQANADLILYKSIRNVVAELRKHAGVMGNVNFVIGSAKAYRNFQMRDGLVHGHLRHGQHRRPQAETSARKKEWLTTRMDHDFDVAYMGHYHVSGRVPWGGPPIIVSPSPKPAGEFVERIGERVRGSHQGVATSHGVGDDGITCVYPIDTRNYDRKVAA